MATQRTLLVRRISTGSVFKILATGIFTSMIPFAVLMGVLAVLGFNTVTWNQQPVTGVSGLIAAPLIGALVGAFLTAFGGVAVAFGLWLYSKFRPLQIMVDEERAQESPVASELA